MKQVNKQAVYRDSILQALKKLAPAVQVHNPVMFIVYIGAIFTTILFIANIAGITDEPSWYVFVIALILWFTVLFANFAEAIAEGRGRAQAESLKKSRKQVIAHKLSSIAEKEAYTDVSSSELQVGDICYVKTGEIIPMDGEVIEGIASVDESAITGESAPVIRESGGDRSAVTGGTTVVSDWIVLRVTAASGASFLDKMIAMVEGAARKKTPNEIALQILLITLTIIFLMVCATLLPISRYVRDMVGQGSAVSLSNVVALLVCLAPTTIGALLSSIGIAGMSRLNQANVLAMSGRAIEAAGDVDVLTHEAGHAFEDYRAFKQELPSLLHSPTIEACECHSMSMEFLTAPWHHLFFGKQTDKYELGHCEDALVFIPYGCMVDEFQHKVYENPEMTPEQRNELWLSLEKKYRPWIDFDNLPFYSRGGGWQRQLHIYEVPLYYIDYCMAQTVAFQFWNLSRENYAEAWKRYMTFVDKAGTATFAELVESAGLKVPYHAGCIKEIGESISRWLEEHELG